MENWTYILASYDIEHNIQQDNADIVRVVKSVLSIAPKVTSNNGSVSMFISVPDYENTETRVIVTLAGKLKDKDLEQAKIELAEFEEYMVLVCKFSVENKAINISKDKTAYED